MASLSSSSTTTPTTTTTTTTTTTNTATNTATDTTTLSSSGSATTGGGVMVGESPGTGPGSGTVSGTVSGSGSGSHFFDFGLNSDAAVREYSDPDQVRRHATAVDTGNVRVLNIDSVYESEWMKGGTHILVTGANRGIGLELCREALKSGARVVGACRKSSPELTELASEHDKLSIIESIDVTDEDACAALAQALVEMKAPPLDVVVQNAGYFPDVADNLDGPGPNYAEAKKQFD
eukprot:UC1_evm1s448